MRERKERKKERDNFRWLRKLMVLCVHMADYCKRNLAV